MAIPQLANIVFIILPIHKSEPCVDLLPANCQTLYATVFYRHSHTGYSTAPGRVSVGELGSRDPAMSKSGFWVPGTSGPGVAQDRDADQHQPVIFNPLAHMTISSQRRELAIYQHRLEVLYAVERYSCVIVSGQAGSGKSTQIPQYLNETGWSRNGYRIICSQPRPLSAVTIAGRVAQEMGVKLGGLVGYSVPFDDCTSAETQIQFVTDLFLIQEMMKDPLLSAFSVVIIDEAHERTLETDILIGLLRKISFRRPDIKVVISSATIDTELFKQFFEVNASVKSEEARAAVISVEGQQYPVQALYVAEPVRDYVTSCVDLCMNIHINLPAGDILAFLPSKSEVDHVVFLLRERMEVDKQSRQLRSLPMYADLHHHEQIKVLEGSERGYRKAIISTNICESSITVPSIVYVIDSGFVKQSAFDSRTGFQTLHTVPISQAEATQRAGRAGRVRSGQVYRLYTEETLQTLQEFPCPAIRRESPHTMVLYLKAIGIVDLVHFEYLEAPSVLALSSALQLLYSLNAVDDNAQLTDVGSSLIDLSVVTRLGKSLLVSVGLACSQEMCDIAAMLSVNNVFSRPRNKQFSGQALKAHKKFAVAEGDMITLLNVWRAYEDAGRAESWCNDHFLDVRSLRRASQIRKRIRSSLRGLGHSIVSCGNDIAPIIKSIAMGFFMNCANLQRDGTYSTISAQGISKVNLKIHPTSVLADQAPQWVLYFDAIHTDQIYIRDLTRIEPHFLKDIAPNFFEIEDSNR
uniref:RNA helicase n=1 Tax=Spongospora subterranea TaxID=70186 RepID=A0A0H5RAJ0_9EUKA|eukprot:CRZ10677.1 hypothetical protein [Spongospora subterranea]